MNIPNPLSELILPIFFTVVLGGLINLWAGFVIADLITYRQTMRGAAKYMHAAFGRRVEGIETYMGVNDFVIQLRDLGQMERADTLFRLGAEFIDTLQRKKILDRLISAHGKWPPELVLDVDCLHRAIQMVRRMHPNY